MSKRGRPPGAEPVEIRRGRVVRLLDLLYDGNQRRAARATGISQAQISRVVAGERPVTDRLLDTLAQQPGVNPRWLLDGEGGPLLPSTRGTLPVAQVILPGPPHDHPGLLTGDRHPVAEVLERDTRYWLSFRAYWSYNIGHRLRIAPDDLLLVETDHEQLDRVDFISGRICAAILSPEAASSLVLGALTVDADGLWLRVFNFATVDREKTQAEPIPPREPPSFIKHGRRVSRLKRPRKEDREAGPEEDAVTADAAGKPTRPPAAGGEEFARSPGLGRVRLSGLTSITGVVLKLERSQLLIDSNTYKD